MVVLGEGAVSYERDTPVGGERRHGNAVGERLLRPCQQALLTPGPDHSSFINFLFITLTSDPA